ncbi:MAG: hypothetical protein K9M80_06645 [Candidatus Marinimicrobia bacterium]|nr:hypothetical protein [Candidatus Neomarinimicrobiota bacterium]
MSECECLEGCPFFNDKMANMPGTAEMYKKKYCKGDFDNCARHMIFEKLGKPAVPGDLFPNNQDRAKRIISAAT